MITKKEAEQIIEGCAYLECLGNLYEFIGTEKKKLIFQAVSDDSYIKTSYENLLLMPEYYIQH